MNLVYISHPFLQSVPLGGSWDKVLLDSQECYCLYFYLSGESLKFQAPCCIRSSRTLT